MREGTIFMEKIPREMKIFRLSKTKFFKHMSRKFSPQSKNCGLTQAP